jgi:hypothetical protein
MPSGTGDFVTGCTRKQAWGTHGVREGAALGGLRNDLGGAVSEPCARWSSLKVVNASSVAAEAAEGSGGWEAASLSPYRLLFAGIDRLVGI